VIAERLTVRAQPPDVSVVPLQEIARWLRHQPRRLGNDDVERLAALVFGGLAPG
jgi:hypothetical protein